jgi:DNA replication protein DnaC
MARASGMPLSQCPTCKTKEFEVAPGVWGWENGEYTLDEVAYPCDCQTQMLLRKHYIHANIPDQYQRLNWGNFTGSPVVTDTVKIYLDAWESNKTNGMGLEFSSTRIGVGKTFAATYIAKELIKRSEAVYFTPFLDVIDLLSKDQEYRNAEESRLRETTVLILDEVVPAISAAQSQFFAMRFEQLIRHRTNFNRVTIMTTNMTPAQLNSEYDRIYSLLEAKQTRIEMTGTDARQGDRGLRNEMLSANRECEPLT